MDKKLLQTFFSKLSRLEEREYLFSTIAYGAAPTLQGVKPSSLISFSSKGRKQQQLWRKYKKDICSSLKIEFFELKETENQQLVLFYNKSMLEESIFRERNMQFLREMGYEDCGSVEDGLQLLKSRFETMCPHEIGVFLGIPLEDICGFIRHKGEKCLFCSYWKVYSNPESARTMFRSFDRARISVIQSILTSKVAEPIL